MGGMSGFRGVVIVVVLSGTLGAAGYFTLPTEQPPDSRPTNISTAANTVRLTESQYRPSLFATLAERTAEAGLAGETASLSNESLAALYEAGTKGKATEIFYVCIRMAHIDARNVTTARFLPACLDEADEYVLQELPDDREGSFWPSLHVRLAEELGALGLAAERERLTAFAADHIWPDFDGDDRTAYGRMFVPLLLEVQGAERAAEFCNQTFGAAQTWAINATDPVYSLLISSFDCFAGLPEGLRTEVDQAFNHALEKAQAEGGRATSIDLLLIAASFQAHHGLDYPLRWEALPQLHQTEGCIAADVPSCVLRYVLEHMQTAPLNPADLNWTSQLFLLALAVGTVEQIDQAQTALRSAYRLTLEQPQFQHQFTPPGYTPEVMIQANISWTMAEWGHVEAGAQAFEAMGPLRASAAFGEMNVVLDLADALVNESGTDRAVEFLSVVLPWQEDAALIFETNMESSGPVWTDHIRLARFYSDVGRSDLARTVLSNAVAVAGYPEKMLALAQAQMFLGFESDAQTTFDDAIALAEMAEAEGAPFFMPLPEVRAIAAVSRIAPANGTYQELQGFPWDESNSHWFFAAVVPY